jgi:ABC-2 type transport system ATP-binding protein
MRYKSDKFRKPVLEYLYIPITLECNRNCKGCVCYSPLAGIETRITLEQFEKAINKFIEITGKETIQQIDISGGESLLHPDILNFLRLSREIFINSNIVIKSNGLLVQSFIRDNYKLLQYFKIGIEYSEYPEVQCDEISYLCNKYKINFNQHWKTSNFKFRKMGINEKPNYIDMCEEWDKCCDVNACHILRIFEDKAYYTGCSTPVFLDILDDYFKTSFEKLLKKGDRIDIFDPNVTLDDILNFHQPLHFCAYCRRRTGIWFNNTEISEKSQNEWIVNEQLS